MSASDVLCSRLFCTRRTV